MFEYDDKIIVRRRKGDSSDPFVQKSELHVINNDGVVILTELPSIFHKVKVTGDNRDWFEITSGTPDINEYKVDYSNKIVRFNSEHIGKQLNFEYMGTGLVYFPITMIYTSENNGIITETLKDYIDEIDEMKDDFAANEQIRQQNESKREEQENVRQQNEQIRQQNEEGRIDREEIREFNESVRVANEENRLSAEQERENNENSRINGENIRESNEQNRIANEQNRQENESQREQQENIRQQNEQVRQEQESQRQTDIYNAITNAEQVTEEAQDLITNSIHLGEYQHNVQYKKNNEVRYNGETWRCIQDVIGVTPSEGDYWTLVARRGQDGTGAVNSVNGKSGDVVLTKHDIGLEIVLSKTAPLNPDITSWWYEDLGESSPFGDGGLLIGNASLIEGEERIWFDKNI